MAIGMEMGSVDITATLRISDQGDEVVSLLITPRMGMVISVQSGVDYESGTAAIQITVRNGAPAS